MRDEVYLSSIRFKLAKGKNDEPLWAETERASQPGDPGGIAFSEWIISGPDGSSFEGADGYLGREYGSGTDGRWEGYDTLGPLINTVTLSGYDQIHNVTPTDGVTSSAGYVVDGSFFPDGGITVGNVDGIATIIPLGGSSQYAYFIRNGAVAKVDLATMTVMNSGLQSVPAMTDIIGVSVASRAVVAEIAVGIGDSASYQVLQAGNVSTSAASPDTWAANSSSQAVRIFGQAPDRIVGCYSNSGLQTVTGNITTGSVTMAAPAWNTVTQITTQPFTFTGFTMDGNLWVVGTSAGPFMLDSQTLQFFNALPELSTSTENMRRASTWYPIGAILPLADGVRQQHYGAGVSWGMERFNRNTSVVTGYPTAHAATTRWLYQALYNAATGDTYIIAWRPRQPEDPHANLLSPFTIAKLTGVQSRALLNAGTANGNRANTTIVGGYGSNAFWFTVGRQAREIDDTNYRYASSGTTFLTEHRTHGVLADIEAVEYWTENHTVNRTSTVGIAINNGAAVTLAAVTSNGFQRVLAVNGTTPLATLQGATRIKPQIAYATNDSTSAPRAYGNLRVYWRWRPLLVKDYTFSVTLEDRGERTAGQIEADLMTAWNSAPVQMLLPYATTPNTAVYVRVGSVQAKVAEDRGGGRDSARGTVWTAEIRATSWQTS